MGKTTLTALLACAFRDMGRKVTVVDADPDPNLAGALGFDDPSSIVPIADMKDLIEERTGAKPGSMGSFFKMNPKVDDIPSEMSREKDGIKLLVLGTVQAGGGCICPESVLLKNLVTYLVLRHDEVVLLDMEAGVEHLGRATAEAVDRLLVVAEPGRRAIETVSRIRKLAAEIGITKIAIVGNKIRDDKDREFLENNSQGIPILGMMPYSEAIITADREGKSTEEGNADLEEVARQIAARLNEAKG